MSFQEGLIMPRSKKSANPFYVLLVIAGVTFAITATAYGVMAFRDAQPATAADQSSMTNEGHPLLAWMDHHGETALMVELAFLAVCTFGAIGTDDYWQRRQRTGSGVLHSHTDRR
jgi:hypothetical protein